MDPVGTLRTMHARREGSSWVLTWDESDFSIAVDDVALDAIAEIGQGLSQEEVTRSVRARTGDDYDVRGLVETLREEGIRPPFTLAHTSTTRFPSVARLILTSGLLAALASLVAVVADPSLLPGLSLVREGLEGVPFGVELAFLVAFLVALVHESGHVIVARSLGLRFRLRFGFRYAFPVLGTEAVGLWRIAPSGRIAFYLAGISLNAVTIAVALFAKASLVSSMGERMALFVDLAVWVALWQVVWQCFLPMRTDLYGVMTTLIARWHLHEEVVPALRSRFARVPRALTSGRSNLPPVAPYYGIPSLYGVQLVLVWLVVIPVFIWQLSVFAVTGLPELFADAWLDGGSSAVRGIALSLILTALVLGGLFGALSGLAQGLKAWLSAVRAG